MYNIYTLEYKVNHLYWSCIGILSIKKMDLEQVQSERSKDSAINDEAVSLKPMDVKEICMTS